MQLRLGRNPLDQAGEDLAGTEFDELVDTLVGQRLDDLDPAHRMPSLAHQRVTDAGGIGLEGHVDVVDQRNGRGLQVDVGQGALQHLAGRLEQHRMERRRDRQHNGTTSPLGLRGLASALDSTDVTGDDHLGRCVEVDRRHFLVLIAARHGASLVAGRLHVGIGQPQDGGHATRAHRHGFLHGLRAQSHELHGRIQIQRTCRDQRRVLTQAVTGHEIGLRTTFGTPGSQIGDAGQQHGRLRPGRQRQLFGGAFGNDPGQQGLTQRRIGARHQGVDLGTTDQRRQHADSL